MQGKMIKYNKDWHVVVLLNKELTGVNNHYLCKFISRDNNIRIININVSMSNPFKNHVLVKIFYYLKPRCDTLCF